MIDLWNLSKLFSVTISLIVVLNCDSISGQNADEFPESSVIRAESEPTLHQMAKRSAQLSPDLQIGEYVPQVAESRVKASVIDSEEDLIPAAGHGYYQYARVPHKKAWEFGYKRGNPKHWREQHEQGHGHKFKTKLKWGDKKGGHGEHYWDYNHAPKHHHKKGHKG